MFVLRFVRMAPGSAHWRYMVECVTFILYYTPNLVVNFFDASVWILPVSDLHCGAWFSQSPLTCAAFYGVGCFSRRPRRRICPESALTPGGPPAQCAGYGRTAL